jgi:hypothetical protein
MKILERVLLYLFVFIALMFNIKNEVRIDRIAARTDAVEETQVDQLEKHSWLADQYGRWYRQHQGHVLHLRK